MRKLDPFRLHYNINLEEGSWLAGIVSICAVAGAFVFGVIGFALKLFPYIAVILVVIYFTEVTDWIADWVRSMHCEQCVDCTTTSNNGAGKPLSTSQ